jgi:hypothetical protein
MSDELKRLTEDGRRLVGKQFLTGETTLEPEEMDTYVEPISGDYSVELASLDHEIDSVVDEYEKFDTKIDLALAEQVHRTLDISRRIAGDPGLWHWLTVVRYPEFVRHRWEFRSEEAMREKFLGAGSDLYSNALHRLWWIAELTSSEGDYDTTEKVFSNQTMVNKVFDRWFARYPPATVAICDELADEPSRVIDETTRRFNHRLTTIQLESLSEDEARDIISDIIDGIDG